MAKLGSTLIGITDLVTCPTGCKTGFGWKEGALRCKGCGAVATDRPRAKKRRRVIARR